MQRIVYFDFLRGIAIIMVVCLHCIDYSAMEGPVLNLFGVEFRNLLNAAVPLFLAISGYFMANKKTDTLFTSEKGVCFCRKYMLFNNFLKW